MDHFLRVFLEPRSLFPSEVHSDTVAGALIQAYCELYGAEEADALVKDEGFRVSSCFPFVKDEDERHVFYPKPLLEPGNMGRDDPNYLDKRKRYRKAGFVHEEIFEAMVEKRLEERDIIGGIDRVYQIKARVIYPGELELDFGVVHDFIPHNTINRLTSQSMEFFYREGVRYNNSGMYFILAADSADTERKLRGAMEFLSDRGLGSDVSVGGGQFRVEVEDFKGLREDGDARVLLSLYNPSPEELKAIDLRSSYYSLEIRRGVTGTGWLRRSVMMFTPGSVLRTEADLRGRVLMVSEDPPNVEWGLYMGVGMDG